MKIKIAPKSDHKKPNLNQMHSADGSMGHHGHQVDESVRLSQVVQRLLSLCTRKSVSLEDFLHELSLYGHMMVCLVFSIPFLLPVPLPGLSTVFGLVIGFAGLQILLGKDPWVPQSWRKREISTDIISRILALLQRILLKTEFIVRPRLYFFARHPGFVRFNGAVILLLAGLLALPMPPGFNFPPALAIIILAIGSFERDGVLIILGYIGVILNVVFFTIFFMLGIEGLKAILGV
jgi:hypothetical protein